MKWLTAVALGAALLLSVAAPAAAADPAIRIRGVEAAPGGVRVVLSGADLQGHSLDPASVRVTIDGRAVTASAVSVTAQKANVQRKVVLVVDTSGSMLGAGITGAKAAARAFLAAAPKDVQVGLVTFSATAVSAVPITHDRARVVKVVNALSASGETALYDGAVAGLDALGSTGLRNLIILSDGADTRSKSSLASLLARLKTAQTRVDVVAFRTDATTGAVLQQLAGAGAGRVLTTADGAGLGRAFTQAAQDLAGELLVTVQVPAELTGRQATLSMSVSSGGTTLSDSIVALLPAATAVASADGAVAAPLKSVAVPTGWLGSKRSLAVGIGAVFLSLLLLLLYGFGMVSPRVRSKARNRRLLSLYTLAGRPVRVEKESTALGDNDIARSAVELAGRVARSRGMEERLALSLDRAAVPLKASEWLVLRAVISLGALLLLVLLTRSALVSLLGAVLASFLPGLVLNVKGSRRRAAFLEAMPDSLQLLAGSLGAGFSLPQAIDAVAREGSEPMSGEFARAVAEARLGVPIEDALDAVADRMSSQDFHWVVMAVRVQREVGGNLADVLSTVAKTMRDRASLRRQVRALSAEGRLSAYVLIGLPILMTLYLFLFRRDYLRPLYSEPLGLVMIAISLVLMVLGSFWMKAVVTVEV